MTAFPASATHTPATFFEPQDADSLWKLVSTPHPLVGKARHLGEALVNADMVAVDAVIAGLQAQQEEQQAAQAEADAKGQEQNQAMANVKAPASSKLK